MVNAGNIKTSAASTTNSSVTVDRTNTTQAIKTEPPILTKAPQLTPSIQQSIPPKNLIVNKQPPVITPSTPKANPVIKKEPIANSVAPVTLPNKVPDLTPASTIGPPPLKEPKLEIKTEPKSQLDKITKNVVTTSNSFNRTIPPLTPTPSSLINMNNSKPPTLTPSTTTPKNISDTAEVKQMPSLTPSTPIAPTISPLSGSSSETNGKDSKLSFGIVDDSVLPKATAKGIFELFPTSIAYDYLKFFLIKISV